MDRRVVGSHCPGHRIDHRLRFLRGGGGIEIVPAAAVGVQQAGEVASASERPRAGGGLGRQGRRDRPEVPALAATQFGLQPAHTSSSSRAKAAAVSAASAATRSVTALKGMFGKAEKSVSVEDMNAAIKKRGAAAR